MNISTVYAPPIVLAKLQGKKQMETTETVEARPDNVCGFDDDGFAAQKRRLAQNVCVTRGRRRCERPRVLRRALLAAVGLTLSPINSASSVHWQFLKPRYPNHKSDGRDAYNRPLRQRTKPINSANTAHTLARAQKNAVLLSWSCTPLYIARAHHHHRHHSELFFLFCCSRPPRHRLLALPCDQATRPPMLHQRSKTPFSSSSSSSSDDGRACVAPCGH